MRLTKIRQAAHRTNGALRLFMDHPATRHANHAIYVGYYGYALAQDHGVRLVFVAIIAAFHTIEALIAETAE